MIQVSGNGNNLQRQWFAVKYCDGVEEYSPSELAIIYYSELLPSAFFLAFDIAVPAVAVAHRNELIWRKYR
jgi:hypothetical protein